MLGICCERKIPSSNPSHLNKSNCVVEKFLLRGRSFNQKRPGLLHVKRQELPLLQATFECSEFGHVDKKRSSADTVTHYYTRKHSSDIVTGCTSASFRAVPLHGIVTLSNRSYHRTNLYACHQIAFWSPRQSSVPLSKHAVVDH